MDGGKVIDILQRKMPRVHCITNPVTMNDMANLVLAVGGSAIMAQSPKEAEDITELCQVTLLNTGVPDEDKFYACMLAGKRANQLKHPLILDPVGVGASDYRRNKMKILLEAVRPTIIRCNQEEACTLLGRHIKNQGGVESGISISDMKLSELARQLSQSQGCTVLISGPSDVISDGNREQLISGGDERMIRLTGSGCMLSALCAVLCGAGFSPFTASVMASRIWKKSAELAGRRTDAQSGGMGSFHMHLMDCLEQVFAEEETE